MEDYDSLIVLSGGLDSTTILLDRLNKGDKVLCLLFDYNQDHIKELTYAERLCAKFNLEYTKLTIPELKRQDDTMIVGNRNLLFLTYAHYVSSLYNIKNIYCGFCEGDDSGFPDCRKVFVDSMESLLELGYGGGVKIHTPLMNVSKSETYFQNYLRGDLSTIIEDTLTCYHGVENLNPWGRGCGECLSCKGRIKGFEDFKEYYFD